MKAIFMFILFLLVVCLLPESAEFTAGGGGNIPLHKNRDHFQVSLNVLQENILNVILGDSALPTQ